MIASTTPIVTTIYRDDAYAADFVQAGDPLRPVIFTFSELGSRNLDGLGFASKFLLEASLNVCAIKSARDLWYQDINPTLFENIATFLGNNFSDTVWRATYGSSMGGFAAIAFSKILRANSVLAISPQFDITQKYDQRWKREALSLPRFRPVNTDDISSDCTYTIVYDPNDLDGVHFDHFSRIIPETQLHAFPLWHSGHPCGPFLRDTGVLKDFVATALLNPAELSKKHNLWIRKTRSAKHLSHNYLFCMAGMALERNKYNLSRSLLSRAIEIEPLNSETHLRLSLSYEKTGDYLRALHHAAIATSCSPKHPAMLSKLAEILLHLDRPRQALVHIDRAIEIQPSFAPLIDLRDRIQKRISP